jgi:ABC-2 type transporter
LGALTLMVPGDAGLGATDPHGRLPNEPAQILMLLNTSAVVLGVALTIRDLVGERAIFRREQSVGLSACAYLGAKIVVFSVAAIIQTAILVVIAVLGKGGPTRGPVVAGNATVELFLTLTATAVVAMILGLAMSSVAKSNEQILPMLVVSIMTSMVFSGALIPVSGRFVLDQVSWIVPARWGFAATAATADLCNIAPLTPSTERLWSHTASWWLLDMVMLIALGLLLAGFVRWRIRLASVCPAARRTRRRRRHAQAAITGGDTRAGNEVGGNGSHHHGGVSEVDDDLGAGVDERAPRVTGVDLSGRHGQHHRGAHLARGAPHHAHMECGLLCPRRSSEMAVVSRPRAKTDLTPTTG